MILLNDEFVDAYKNRIVIKCFDEILRRVYPWILTYSADYSEKWAVPSWILCLCSRHWPAQRVLLATIQDKGLCPCPRCLVPKSMFHHTEFIRDLGARISDARTYICKKIALTWCAIYELGQPLKGMTIETILKNESLVPTLVWTLLTNIILSVILWCLPELFLRATITLGLQPLQPPSHGFVAWIWAWSPEEHSETLTPNSACCWSPQDWDTQWIVSCRTLPRSSFWHALS